MGNKKKPMLNKVIASILLITMLTGILNGSIIYLWFKINQEYIAAELCEQRDRPESSCNGNCQLQKKLAESEKNTPENPKAIPQPETLSFFLPPPRQSMQNNKVLHLTNKYPKYTHPFSGTEVPAEIFHPPRG
jgi:hypothetical protein